MRFSFTLHLPETAFRRDPPMIDRRLHLLELWSLVVARQVNAGYESFQLSAASGNVCFAVAADALIVFIAQNSSHM